MEFFNIYNFNNFNCKDDNFQQKIKNLIISFLLVFLIFFVIAIIIIFPLDFFITKYLHFESVRDLIHQNQKKILNYPLYLVVFIGPFIEELLFRLVLKATKFSIAVFMGFLSYKLQGGQIIKFDFHNTFFLYFIITSIIISILSYCYFPAKVIDFLNQKRKWLIIISIILFGLVHISNIKTLYWQLALLYPFFVLPQMIMGYFITNLRLKYGFFWGFLLHILINSSSFLF